MIAGAVTPARMDLQNEELVKAHLNSTWLSLTGLHLGNGMADVLDLRDHAYPIAADMRSAFEGSSGDRIFSEAVALSKRIVRRAQDIRSASWFSEEWIDETLRSTPALLNNAFETWRGLYRSACDLRDKARLVVDDPHASWNDRQEAERREAEALREIRVLLNQTNRQVESDFYPYRYLAGEGFLPGYNFPRLPVRTSVTVGDTVHYIDRPRFLGLSEFGPGNQVYHEGRKHRIHSAVLPPAGIGAQLSRARLCNICGYAHEGREADDVELCTHCGTRLDAATSEFPQRLLNQPMMRARVVERISSEEEERVRSGYAISTHFSLPGSRTQRSKVLTSDEDPVLDLFFAPAARLWRINHGWRRGERNGFEVDPQNGRWGRRDTEDSNDGEPGVPQPITGVKPYVQDGRNILMIRTSWDDDSEEFHISLLYALKRAIQLVYQVEEQEVGADLIGQGEYRRLLFWEEAEGGTGVWERLAREPDAIAVVARQALVLCHFDPDTGEDAKDHDVEKCDIACYECLLTYSNQLHHRQINRRLLPDFLRMLASGKTVQAEAKDREAQYDRLKGLVDPGSSLEREFLRYLYDNQIRLPDHAQNRPTQEVHVQPDFYYERDNIPGICVFIDGPHHDTPVQNEQDVRIRNQLRDLGFRVITIRYDQSIADQVEQHPDVFVVEG